MKKRKIIKGFGILALGMPIVFLSGCSVDKISVDVEYNDGTDVTSYTITSGTTFFELENPTRDGYTFINWYSDELCTIEFDFNSELTSDTTIYASWSINNYTVNYYYNGNKKTLKANYNVVLPTFEPEGELGTEFEDWYIDEGFVEKYDDNAKITGPLNLYANYVDSIYSVTYYDGNNIYDSDSDLSYNESIESPVEPVKNGYKFTGWYIDNACTELYNFSDSDITESISLYAGWDIFEYTVSFETNGGTSVDSAQVYYNGMLLVQTITEKDDYYFAGWYYDNVTFENEFTIHTKVTDNITVYACWKSIYTVDFDGSDLDAQLVVDGTLVEIPTSPEMEGYVFAGYYSDATFSTEFDFNNEIYESTTIYCRWYTIITDTSDFDSYINSNYIVGDILYISGEIDFSNYNYDDTTHIYIEKELNLIGINDAKIISTNYSTSYLIKSESSISIENIAFESKNMNIIFVNQNNLTVDNCSFVGMLTSSQYAIVNFNGYLDVQNSTFDSFITSSVSDITGRNSAAIYSYNSNVYITDNVFGEDVGMDVALFISVENATTMSDYNTVIANNIFNKNLYGVIQYDCYYNTAEDYNDTLVTQSILVESNTFNSVVYAIYANAYVTAKDNSVSNVYEFIESSVFAEYEIVPENTIELEVSNYENMITYLSSDLLTSSFTNENYSVIIIATEEDKELFESIELINYGTIIIAEDIEISFDTCKNYGLIIVNGIFNSTFLTNGTIIYNNSYNLE